MLKISKIIVGLLIGTIIVGLLMVLVFNIGLLVYLRVTSYPGLPAVSGFSLGTILAGTGGTRHVATFLFSNSLSMSMSMCINIYIYIYILHINTYIFIIMYNYIYMYILLLNVSTLIISHPFLVHPVFFCFVVCLLAAG